jgi:uncharacterized protein YbjT (DUF2867 family)
MTGLGVQSRPERVLIVGAAGFIGSAVTAHLAHRGYEITASVRRLDRHARKLPAAVVELPLENATHPKAWESALRGVDAVVNCAGLLQSGSRGSTDIVHTAAPAALFEACQAAGIRRVILLSAIGVGESEASDFSTSKRAGEDVLRSTNLDWVILRPSFVLGEAAFGGSALFRSMASLPFIPRLAWAAPVQPVQLSDLLGAIEFFLKNEAPARVTLDLAGPERLSVEALAALYRQWFGSKPAGSIGVPEWVARIAARLGDGYAWLGWASPIRSNSVAELRRGAIGNPDEWLSLMGMRPEGPGEALARRPPSLQERWFSRLFLLKPLVISIFALFWIATGVVSLGPGWARGISLLDDSFLEPFAALSVAAGAAIDILLGVMIAFRRTSRIGLYGALSVSAFYAVMGTLIQPVLWTDPLGPMLKIWPIMVLNLVAIAIVDDR